MAERNTPYPVVPGLTDARRAELQNMIADHRQKYPVLVIFPSLANVLTCTVLVIYKSMRIYLVRVNSSGQRIHKLNDFECVNKTGNVFKSEAINVGLTPRSS